MSSSPQKKSLKEKIDESTTETEADFGSAIAAAQEPNLKINRSLIPSVPLQDALSGSTKQELDILAQLGVQSFNTSEVEQNVLQQVDAAFEKQEHLNEQLLKNVRQKKQVLITKIRQVGKPTSSNLKQQLDEMRKNLDELRGQETALVKKLNQFRQQRVIEDAGFEEALLHKEQTVPTRRLIPLPVNNTINTNNTNANVNNNNNNAMNNSQADSVNKYLAEISKRNANKNQSQTTQADASNNTNTNTLLEQKDIKSDDTKQSDINSEPKKAKRATQPRTKRRKKNDGASDDDYDSVADSDEEAVLHEPRDDDEEVVGDESDESSSSRSRKRKRTAAAAWQDDSNEDFYADRLRAAKALKTLLHEDETTELSPGYRIATRVFNNLFEHQLVGIRWLWELHQQASGGIIADEMGLGKTITTIGYLSALFASGAFDLDNHKKKKMILVVCPATVMQQWVSEFHHWGPDFRIVLFHRLGVTSVKKSQRTESAANKLPLGEQFAGLFSKYVAPLSATDTAPLVVITSYESVRIYSEVVLAIEWSYVVLDEGHKLRNPNANVTIACKQFLTPHRLILTGAPIQNNLVELWSLFDFIFPGKLGTLPMFQRQFSDPITRGGYASATQLQRQLAMKCAVVLRDLIKPYLLRRLKSDVNLMLPQKTEQVLFCKLTAFQREEYIKFLGSREGLAVIRGLKNPLYGMDVLRKICNHPDLLLLLEAKKAKFGIEDDDEESNASKARKYGRRNVRAKIEKTYSYKYEHGLDDSPAVVEGEHAAATETNVQHGPQDSHDNAMHEENSDEDERTRLQVTRSHIERSAKLQVLKQVLKLWSQQGHKVLLFSQTRQMLDIIEAFINEEGYAYNRMDGTTPIGARQALISQFNDPNSGLFVFLLTTKVGGLGVNLTGANRVILFDPDWNPSTDLQARERSYRIGQNRDVVIFRLITSGTIEEKIYHRQIFKQFLTNRILRKHQGTLTGANAFFKSKDLRELFSLDEKNDTNETSRIFGEHLDTEAMTGVKSEPLPTSTANTNAMEVDEKSHVSDTGEKNEGDEESNSDEDWLLKGLVGKALQSTLDHDAIMDLEGEHEHRPKPKKKSAAGRKIDREHAIWNELDDTVNQLTTEYARRAAEQLRQEREELKALPINKPTWTGKRGFAPDGAKGPRFGLVSSALTPVKSDSSAGAGFSKSDTGLSSSNVLAELKAKNPVVNIREQNKPRDEHVKLIADIREFILERGGSALSKDLVDKFKQRVSGHTMEVFKNLLKQVADLNKAERAWYLKEEFK